jgi:hypothetical protein
LFAAGPERVIRIPAGTGPCSGRQTDPGV